MEDIHARLREEQDRERRQDFRSYGWRSYFAALSGEQLAALRLRWYRALQRSEGHELLVMRWNMLQLNREIMRRACEKGGCPAPQGCGNEAVQPAAQPGAPRRQLARAGGQGSAQRRLHCTGKG